jgi:hypothetical protein
MAINNARLVTNKITANNIHDTTVILKNFKISYSSPKRSASFYGSAKLVQDTSILISLRAPLGIELSRVLLKPDIVQVLDRQNDTYLIGDYSYFKDRFHLDLNFNLIYSLLIGNFPNGYQLLTNKGKVIRPESYASDSLFVGNYYRSSENHYKFSLWLHPELFKAKSLVFYKKRNIEEFNVSYYDFTKYSSHYIPGNLTIKSGSDRQKYTIDLKYRSISFSSDANINFQVPSKYKKVYIK